MECLECGMEYDEDFYDDCPYCGCSKDAVVCPDCNSVVDDDDTCSVCGYMFHDEYEDYYIVYYEKFIPKKWQIFDHENFR